MTAPACGRPPLRAVVCDMDGLLVDSERLERHVWQAAAADSGFALSDELFLTFIGRGADDAERVLAERLGASFVPAAYRARREARMTEALAAGGVPLKAGARELVAFLVARGVRLGLATSSGPAAVWARVGEFVPSFHAVTTRADVARAKPHPDLYLTAAARLGVPPDACLALEDSPPGVRAAAAAGMAVFLVPDLVPPTPEVTALCAGVFPSLVEVRQALGAIFDGAGRPVTVGPA